MYLLAFTGVGLSVGVYTVVGIAMIVSGAFLWARSRYMKRKATRR